MRGDALEGQRLVTVRGHWAGCPADPEQPRGARDPILGCQRVPTPSSGICSSAPNISCGSDRAASHGTLLPSG